MYFQAEAQRTCAGSESERVKWFQGFCLYRGVILWKGNDCGRSRVGWAEMELQVWPGLWPNRESLLSGPRLPARYQQLPPEAWLCQETPLLAVGRRIVETEVSFSSLIYFLVPRQPTRYQQLPLEAWLCQETPLLAVGRIAGTEGPFSFLISLNPQFSSFLVQAIVVSRMVNSLLTLVTLTFISLIRRLQWDFLGDTVDKSLPANAGDTGLIPIRARFHNAAEQLSLRTTTAESSSCNNWRHGQKPPQWEACALRPRGAPGSPQLKKALTKQWRPRAAKNK